MHLVLSMGKGDSFIHTRATLLDKLMLAAGNVHHIIMYLTAGHINITVLLSMNTDKVLFWIILTWNKTQTRSVHGVLQHVPQCSTTWTQDFIFISNRWLQNTIWQPRGFFPIFFLYPRDHFPCHCTVLELTTLWYIMQIIN